MGVKIGLDIGGSTTKIVGFKAGKLINLTQVKASDPLTSAYGALGKLMEETAISLDEVENIKMTGVGTSWLKDNILNRPAIKVPEFDCVGIGGLYLSGKERAVIVSIGTGTSIVSAEGKNIQHIIGSGVGGGTVLGLSKHMLSVQDFKVISQLSLEGDINNVDLTVGDLSMSEIPSLPLYTTASNFGKLNDLPNQSDLAAGILNLVFQSIGTSAVLSARLAGMKNIVITGNLSQMVFARDVFKLFSELYQLEFVIPEAAEFATAIGAALYQEDL